MKAWRFVGDQGACPDAASLAYARPLVNYRGVALDGVRLAVRFARPGMLLDFGAAGKGHAVDAAIERLRENGVRCALLHGGTSSVYGIGSFGEERGWRIGWNPRGASGQTFELRDSALAVSGIDRKAFRAGNRVYGHVMDPVSGSPTSAARSAVVTGPQSFECDALSTALLVRGAGWLPALRAKFPGYDGAALS
jgi:thiamine biosynthesis lipoprotein